ncbi:unnamed protein product, partial [marine sediment metagenome]
PQGREALEQVEVRRRLQELEQQIHERLERTRRAGQSPTTIPAHNPRFAGRLDELRDLHRMLTLENLGAITAVHGIPGIGKSALAFEYGHAFADQYPGGRFLAACAQATDLRVPILNLAPQFGVNLTDEDRKDIDLAYGKLRAGVADREATLILLDNVDNPALLTGAERARWLPIGPNIFVLITTRVVAEGISDLPAMNLDRLPTADARDLLAKYRPIPSDADFHAATAICERLGGHPLALEVVAVYLWRNPDESYGEFLAGLERR